MAVLAGDVLRAGEHPAGEGGRGDLVGDEADRAGLLRPQAASHRVGRVPDGLRRGAHPAAGLFGDPRGSTSFMTSETVVTDTPAAAATSEIRTRATFALPCDKSIYRTGTIMNRIPEVRQG